MAKKNKHIQIQKIPHPKTINLNWLFLIMPIIGLIAFNLFRNEFYEDPIVVEQYQNMHRKQIRLQLATLSHLLKIYSIMHNSLIACHPSTTLSSIEN